jgi:hypothetical protein
MKREDLTKEKLQELLDYDPENGIFKWNVDFKKNKKGCIAGGLNPYGYIHIIIGRKTYMAHRLAWLYVHGKHPSADIDHINCVKTDNRIVNLREASRYENLQNQKRAHSNNKSGLLGVYFDKSQGKFRSRIRVNGVAKHVGLFDTKEEAHEAYIEAKRRFHPFSTI